VTTILAATVREEIADFLGALLLVYLICIIAWIVLSFIFSMGLRVPYNRWFSALMDFLRDVTEPYLRIFRPLPLRIGPLDLTPIVAIFLLQIVGGIVISVVRG
jgi:YggT family protein